MTATEDVFLIPVPAVPGAAGTVRTLNVRTLDAAPFSRLVTDWSHLGVMAALTCDVCGYYAQQLNGEPDPNLPHICTDDEGRALLRCGGYEVEL